MQNQERGVVQDQDVQGSFPGKFENIIGLDDPGVATVKLSILTSNIF